MFVLNLYFLTMRQNRNPIIAMATAQTLVIIRPMNELVVSIFNEKIIANKFFNRFRKTNL